MPCLFLCTTEFYPHIFVQPIVLKIIQASSSHAYLYLLHIFPILLIYLGKILYVIYVCYVCYVCFVMYIMYVMYVMYVCYALYVMYVMYVQYMSIKICLLNAKQCNTCIQIFLHNLIVKIFYIIDTYKYSIMSIKSHHTVQ